MGRVPVFETANLLPTLRHQTRIVLHITRRDLFKRLSSGTFILAICWYGGDWVGVLVIAALIAATELAVRGLADRLPARDEDIPLSLIGAVWGINTASTIAYIFPAVLLAGQGSVPLLLIGFMWMFGIYVHISNSFVALPIYNWSQMIPSFLSSFYVIWKTSRVEHDAGELGEWLFLIAAMTVYISNTVETLALQKDTQRALAAARAEAANRLKALEHMTRHDGLTGLKNRQAFDVAVAAMLARRKSEGQVAVFMLDLDGFKPINDTYSHEAGDTVLITIGRRLESIAGESGVAARFGGDEFGLAMPGVTAVAARRIAARITAEIAEPIPWGDKVLRAAASVGICLSGQAETSVSTLCACADQAMYRAKSQGAGRAVLYDAASFPARLTPRNRQALAEAVASGAIRPHYQPKVDLLSGRLVGFEALARWHHPERGVLAPVHFLNQINEMGLQADFLTAMARHLARDVASLLSEGLDPGQVSLNLPEIALATQSVRQDLDRILADHPDIVPHLVFEITEDVFVTRSAEIIQDSIARFRDAGLRISLDDFGTGFASFSHLRRLAIDEIKIDSSFVLDLGTDPVAGILVEGFLSIARGLGVTAIAEGVETEEQRRRLLAMGCRYAQGYLFGRAMPFADMRLRLAEECLPRRLAT